MSDAKIEQLIINSPYEEPTWHYNYDRETRQFKLEAGRRKAGYLVATPDSKSFDDPGIFIEIKEVNKIRERVSKWRKSGYPGVSGITKQLLEHWYDPEERSHMRFFFCQLEAIETLIWLNEAPPSEKTGINIKDAGGVFDRLCCKMATGSGKTVVMAMLIAWQILNKVTYPMDTRFSRNIFIVAPGLTVKSRLQVLKPDEINNYYDEFNVIPPGLIEKLRQGNVLITNWHSLMWDDEEALKKRKSVDKRGPKSDEAYVREVLGDMSRAQNIVVINDEAHHAWRVPAESKIKGLKREEIEQATKWIEGLDRIHRTRGILSCYDFSATPFAPTGKKATEVGLFEWIVSDFSLNDAIESGLVKTPRVVVRDDAVPDAKSYRSKLYHIYVQPDVREDLSRKAEEHEPLPDLVTNAYYLLGWDWRETAKEWAKSKRHTSPVMITVANRTETAARIRHAFESNDIKIPELCDPERMLHIDSKVLAQAEQVEEPVSLSIEVDEDDTKTKKLTKKELAELLRQQVDTVGKPGKPGENIQKVISVGMLSEGWDAKTVTHIMGLRAFSSQLLCEQVVGRGLRRTSYEINKETKFFDPEYVNIFGVPFTFLPHESKDGPPPPPPTPKTLIDVVPEKIDYEITWPNVLRIETILKPVLEIDHDKIKPLVLNAWDNILLAQLAPIIDGKPDVTRIEEIKLEELGREQRMQKIIFETAHKEYEKVEKSWKGSKVDLMAQLVRIIEGFLRSDLIQIEPPLFNQDELRRRILLTLNMSKIVQHIWEAIRKENTEKCEPVFDREHPIRSTSDMRSWYTGKPCEYTQKSHVNYCVYDSTWEASDAFVLDSSDHVDAWVKNDHIGFVIYYSYKGVIRKYYPDFIIRLKNGKYLVLETKGHLTSETRTKRTFLEEWIRAVNEHGGFGEWHNAVADKPGMIHEILAEIAE